MKRTKTISKKVSQREPFIAGFILPVLLLAAFAPTLLFQTQGDVPGDPNVIKEPPKVETPSEKEARMLAAFDNPNMIPGQLIVSFTDGTTLEQANAILASFNLSIDQKQVCTTPQAANPNGGVTNGPQSCTSDGWFESISAGRVLVESGQEKTVATQLYHTNGVVWVEPNYTASVADGGNSLGVEDTHNGNADNQTMKPINEMQPVANTNTILGIEPLMLVVGVLLVGFGAFFLMKKN